MGRGRPPRVIPVDEVQVAEAVVAFYEARLEEAYARLGAAIEYREGRKKLSGRGG